MDYQAEIDHLKQQVFERRQWRDAQAEGDDLYERFQAEITQLTRLQLEWQAAVPDLQAVDARIREARLVMSRAQRREDQVAARPVRAAGWLGVPGASTVVLGLAWSAPWQLIVAGLVLVGVGVLLLMRGLGARRATAEATDSAYAKLQVLNAERDELFPRTASPAPDNEVFLEH